MAGVKYNYAFNEQGHVVSISQAANECEEGHTYHCIGCGSGMIARLGKVREWHFAHRNEDNHCGSETYLHKLAKSIIKERFEKEGPFEICYYRDKKCSDIKTCPFADEEECHIKGLMKYDLKKYYDTCEEEKPINNYVADLLLTNSSKIDQHPILIEIRVSHECTQDKRASGLRIIEIHLKTEKDIDYLIKGPITQKLEDEFDSELDESPHGIASFYGFKDTTVEEQLNLRKILRFYLFRSGKAHVTEQSCRHACEKEDNKAIFEVSIDSQTPYEIGYLVAREKGFIVKTCLFCKYQRRELDGTLFCCLYKKFGTPLYPSFNYAKDCKYYREERGRLETIRKSMPPIVIPSNS